MSYTDIILNQGHGSDDNINTSNRYTVKVFVRNKPAEITVDGLLSPDKFDLFPLQLISGTDVSLSKEMEIARNHILRFMDYCDENVFCGMVYPQDYSFKVISSNPDVSFLSELELSLHDIRVVSEVDLENWVSIGELEESIIILVPEPLNHVNSTSFCSPEDTVIVIEGSNPQTFAEKLLTLEPNLLTLKKSGVNFDNLVISHDPYLLSEIDTRSLKSLDEDDVFIIAETFFQTSDSIGIVSEVDITIE